MSGPFNLLVLPQETGFRSNHEPSQELKQCGTELINQIKRDIDDVKYFISKYNFTRVCWDVKQDVTEAAFIEITCRCSSQNDF